jgi:tellurite resistance protein TerB
MFNFLKAKAFDLAAAANKFKDKETAEAIVAVMTGTAYADGTLEPEEREKIKAAIKVNPVLKQFDASMLTTKFFALSEQCEFDPDFGKDMCLKELKDVGQHAPEEKRIAILRMGVAAARADGEIEDDEVVFLRRACSALGIAPSQVGL